MIIIDVPNLTDRQRRMLTALWKLSQIEEVEEWIQSQPTEALRQEAQSMKELIFWAILDTETEVDLARKELDRILR